MKQYGEQNGTTFIVAKSPKRTRRSAHAASINLSVPELAPVPQQCCSLVTFHLGNLCMICLSVILVDVPVTCVLGGVYGALALLKAARRDLGRICSSGQQRSSDILKQRGEKAVLGRLDGYKPHSSLIRRSCLEEPETGDSFMTRGAGPAAGACCCCCCSMPGAMTRPTAVGDYDSLENQWRHRADGITQSQDKVGRSCAASSARDRGGFVLSRRSLGSPLHADGVCRHRIHRKAGGWSRGQRMARAVQWLTYVSEMYTLDARTLDRPQVACACIGLLDNSGPVG